MSLIYRKFPEKGISETKTCQAQTKAPHTHKIHPLIATANLHITNIYQMKRYSLRDGLSQLKMGIWGDLPAKSAYFSLLAVKEISSEGFIRQCLTRAIQPACSKQHRSFLVLSECFKRNWIPQLWLYVAGLILELETICLERDSAVGIMKLLRQRGLCWTTGLVTKELWKADLGRCQIGFQNPPICSSKYAGAEILWVILVLLQHKEILILDRGPVTL